MSEAAGSQTSNQPAEAAEVAPDGLGDAAHVASVAADPSAAPPPAADPEPVAPPVRPRDSKREEIAARFTRDRAAHNPGYAPPDELPPAVAAAGAPPAPDPAAAATPAPAAATPAPAAPQSYTLKVRGQERQVDRAELLRLADVEAHEEADYDDARLIRYAQKNAAADVNLELARQARQAPPAPTATAPAQAAPAPAAPAPADLPALARDYHEKLQYGTPEEATAAYTALRTAEDQQRTAAQVERERLTSFANDGQAAVRDFAAANPDMQNNPLLHDAMLMTVTREMEADLRRAGLTDQDLTGSVGNPHAMSDLYRAARHHGLPVRSQRELLDAAGRTVRAGLGLPPQPAAAVPAPVAPPSAAPSRLDAKRALPAQPERSGSLPPVTPPPLDVGRSRTDAVADMRNRRKVNNVAQMAG